MVQLQASSAKNDAGHYSNCSKWCNVPGWMEINHRTELHSESNWWLSFLQVRIWQIIQIRRSFKRYPIPCAKEQWESWNFPLEPRARMILFCFLYWRYNFLIPSWWNDYISLWQERGTNHLQMGPLGFPAADSRAPLYVYEPHPPGERGCGPLVKTC